jgi:hypothetical protein
MMRYFTCALKRVESYYRDLQGRVEFPTGGDSPRAHFQALEKHDAVKFCNRQYSLDGRRYAGVLYCRREALETYVLQGFFIWKVWSYE